MTLVPAATPVTTPAVVTVATVGVADAHGVVACAVAEPASVIVEPAQTVDAPVIVGFGFTVIVCVCVQPFVFIYVIALVPAPTPVTTPAGVTVATVTVADVHGVVACAVAEPASVIVEPTHTVDTSVTIGLAFTVIVCTSVQPFVFM